MAVALQLQNNFLKILWWPNLPHPSG